MTLQSHSSFLQSVRRTGQYVCWRCQQRRTITQNFLKRKEEGRQQWADFAKEIRAGQRKSMLTILKERGLVHTIAGEEKALDRLMIDKRIGVYVGIDPTASSLHVGHLLPLMALFWMHIHGFHTVSLLGASTARIGDPTGRTSDRPQMTPTERKANVAAMHYQIKRLWLNVERVSAKHGYKYETHWRRELVNNAVWWNSVPFLDVLKILGRGIRLGTMLGRDTVKTKMASGDGMSFAEFCYPLMQAWDWWRMYEEKGVQMQIGGSDQFGNIVAGIDAVKYIAKSHPDPLLRQENGVSDGTAPYGFTVPLLTTASGAKFGKSAGNAIWLDQAMTTLFDLYAVSKFFIRTADADVERYLKLFTFLPLSEIQSLMDQHKQDPSKRIPHHKLAKEFVDLIHGEQAAKTAEEQHRAMFQKQESIPALADLKPVKPNPLASNQNAETRLKATYLSRALNKYATIADHNSTPAQHTILPKCLIFNQSIAKILWAAELVSSRSEGHRLAESGGAYVGMRPSGKEQMKDDIQFVPIKLRDPNQSWDSVIRDDASSGEMEREGEEGLLILRVGKWKIRIVRVVSDEKFRELGIEGPQAWKEVLAKDAVDSAQDSLRTANQSRRPRSEENDDDIPEPDAQEFEILTAEDTAHFRTDLAESPNPALGQAKKKNKKAEWESLLQQQALGRLAYRGEAIKDSSRLTGDVDDDDCRSHRKSLDDVRAELAQTGITTEDVEDRYSIPQHPPLRPSQAFKNLVGFKDDKRNHAQSSTSSFPSSSSTNTDPYSDNLIQPFFRRVQGDSTAPTYGRLAALHQPDPDTLLTSTKTFDSATKAEKRKRASVARKSGKLVGEDGEVRGRKRVLSVGPSWKEKGPLLARNKGGLLLGRGRGGTRMVANIRR